MKDVFKMLTVSALLCCGLAQADPVTWYLQEVKFTDGGSASGSFSYDAEKNVYADVAIATTEKHGYAGATYAYGSLLALFTPSAKQVNFSHSELPEPQDGNLILAFAVPLTNAGGDVPIATGHSMSREGICIVPPFPKKGKYSCGFGGRVNWVRAVASGSVTTRAPE